MILSQTGPHPLPRHQHPADCPPGWPNHLHRLLPLTPPSMELKQNTAVTIRAWPGVIVLTLLNNWYLHSLDIKNTFPAVSPITFYHFTCRLVPLETQKHLHKHIPCIQSEGSKHSVRLCWVLGVFRALCHFDLLSGGLTLSFSSNGMIPQASRSAK